MDRVEAQHEAVLEDDPGTIAGGDHRVGVGQFGGQRLLAEDVPARPRRRLDHRPVEIGRRGDHHRIHGFQEPRDLREPLHAKPLRRGLYGLRARVAHGREARALDRLQRLRVRLPHSAYTDNAHSQHVSLLLPTRTLPSSVIFALRGRASSSISTRSIWYRHRRPSYHSSGSGCRWDNGNGEPKRGGDYAQAAGS